MVALALLIGALFSGATTAAATPRVEPVALEATDPFVGLWQNGASIIDVLASGEARIVSDPIACRVGAVDSKDLVKVAEGHYTVSNGKFEGEACAATSFTPGVELQVAGDALTVFGTTYNRLAATALAPTDPILGQWQSPDGNSVNEVRADGSVRIVKGPQCRIGQLDSYDLKQTAPGTYSVRNGVFAPDGCTATSFTPGFTLTVGPDGLRPGGGTGSPWTKLVTQPPPPTVAPKDLNSLIVIHHDINGHWVPCGLAVFDKSDEVQDLIAKLGLEKPGMYNMDATESAKLDDVMLRQNADNDLTDDLYKPMLDAAQAAAAGPVGGIVPVQTDGDVGESFRAVCVRRS